MDYELFALRYGQQPDLSTRDTVIFPTNNDNEQPKRKFEYYFWLAKSDKKTILIDCGFNADQAQSRGRSFTTATTKLLKEVGLTPDDISDIILTHLHYDHAGNLEVFENATLHIHSLEWAWATGSKMADPILAKYYERSTVLHVINRLYDGRVNFVSEKETIFHGIRLLHVGGHSPGQMIIGIPTESGEYILASDACHLLSSLESNNPFPIFIDLSEVLGAYQLMKNLQDSGSRIIAGHDPEVMINFNEFGSTGNIVALHEGRENA